MNEKMKEEDTEEREEKMKVVDEEEKGSKGGGRQKRDIRAPWATVCSSTDRPLMSISTFQISIITNSAHKNAINVYPSAI